MRKRNIKIAAAGIVFCMTLGACGVGSSGETAEESRQQEENDSGRTGETEQTGETEEQAQIGSIAAESGNKENVRSLTDEELQQFSDYVNQNGNYGFLLSVYETPADVVLDQVLYSGAGVETGQADEAEVMAYLKATGEEELYTDLTHLTGAQIDAFLQEKTGLSYSEMNHPLSWIYLPEYDSYYWEHGDTNYQSFLCTGGSTADENTFTLRFVPKLGFWGEEQSGYHIIPYETVLQKSGDGYRFLSNRMRLEDGQIKEQTFDVEMTQWGNVTFATYAPDTERNPYCDVTFSVVKDDVCVSTLPGMDGAWNMLAAAESFDSVEAVSFPDYNGDGYTDVIAIINYSYVQGPDAGTGYTQARIYTGHEEEYFTLECEPSAAAGEVLGDEMTVADILTFIQEHGAEYGIAGGGALPVE